MNQILKQMKSGMRFENYAEVRKYFGFDCSRTNLAGDILKHYCNFHKDGSEIVIDEVFDKVIPFKKIDFVYDVEDIIKCNTGSFTIIDKYRDKDPYKNSMAKWYLCKCNKDGYKFNLMEKRIKQGLGCPICGNRKIIPKVRSIYDQHQEIKKYLLYPEDENNSLLSTADYVLCKCPECGSIRSINVGNLVKHGFTCSVCSDHISYPNKFIRNFLEQLNIEYFPEKSFEWSNGKIYDQFIPSISMLIENHGLQHFEECGKFEKTYDEQVKNDLYKEFIAKENGIKYYITLDCRISNKEWIKKSILESELPRILNFKESDVDWDLCDILAQKSIVPMIWDEWNKTHDIDLISKEYKKNHRTIRNYINKGYEYNMCDYSVDGYYKANINSKRIESRGKPIYCVTDDIYFKSKNEVGEYYKNIFTKTSAQNLYVYINSNRPYKGKLFKYISREEFNNKKTESDLDVSINVIGDYYKKI